MGNPVCLWALHEALYLRPLRPPTAGGAAAAGGGHLFLPGFGKHGLPALATAWPGDSVPLTTVKMTRTQKPPWDFSHFSTGKKRSLGCVAGLVRWEFGAASGPLAATRDKKVTWRAALLRARETAPSQHRRTRAPAAPWLAACPMQLQLRGSEGVQVHLTEAEAEGQGSVGP